MTEWYYIGLYHPKFNSMAPITCAVSEEWRKKISDTTKKLYTEKGYVNPRKGVGQKFNVYNILGDLVYSNLNIPEIAKRLGLKSYSNTKNLANKYNGVCRTFDSHCVIREDRTIEDLMYQYKHSRMGYTVPLCDTDGNIYTNTGHYLIKGNKKTGPGVTIRSIRKQVLDSEHLFVIFNNKIFTLPGLCRFIQKWIPNNT